MLACLHLLRHGEVFNPNHLVYADLPGFRLSSTGRAQAEAAAARLARNEIDAVVASPLERAVETAEIVTAATGVALEIDERLTEWGLGMRWAGVAWEDLPAKFPGELEAYLATPTRLPFAPESIAETASRVEAVVRDLGERHPGGRAVLVSHQDPVQAIRLRLTGRPLTELAIGKPAHCTVLTLKGNGSWSETERWDPPQPSDEFPPSG